jgi:hypothetical protein
LVATEDFIFLTNEIILTWNLLFKAWGSVFLRCFYHYLFDRPCQGTLVASNCRQRHFCHVIQLFRLGIPSPFRLLLPTFWASPWPCVFQQTLHLRLARSPGFLKIWREQGCVPHTFPEETSNNNKIVTLFYA